MIPLEDKWICYIDDAVARDYAHVEGISIPLEGFRIYFNDNTVAIMGMLKGFGACSRDFDPIGGILNML